MKLKNLLLLALVFTNRMAAATTPNAAANSICSTDEKFPLSSFNIASQALLRPVQSSVPPTKAQLRHKVFSAVNVNDADDLNNLLDRYEFDVNDVYNNSSLLNEAVKLNHTAVVDVLIANGANVYWEGIEPKTGILLTPIRHAIMNGNSETVRIFLKYGFDSNHLFTANISSFYILCYAICDKNLRKTYADRIPHNYLTILDMLVVKGDINFRPPRRQSPLQLAIRENHLPFAKALLERGAIVADEMIDHAKKYGFKEIVKLLQEYQAKQSTKLSTWVCGVLALAGTCYKAAMGYSFYKTHQQASTKKTITKKPDENFQAERDAKKAQARELLTKVDVKRLVKNEQGVLVEGGKTNKPSLRMN